MRKRASNLPEYCDRIRHSWGGSIGYAGWTRRFRKPGTQRHIGPMQIDRKYLENALAALVRINSVNPKFSDGSTDELAIATHLDGVMRAL